MVVRLPEVRTAFLGAIATILSLFAIAFAYYIVSDILDRLVTFLTEHNYPMPYTLYLMGFIFLMVSVYLGLVAAKKIKLR